MKTISCACIIVPHSHQMKGQCLPTSLKLRRTGELWHAKGEKILDSRRGPIIKPTDYASWEKAIESIDSDNDAFIDECLDGKFEG